MALEELEICLVHGAKVLHVSQIDVDLDDVVEAAARGFEDVLEVRQGPFLVCFISFGGPACKEKTQELRIKLRESSDAGKKV